MNRYTHVGKGRQLPYKFNVNKTYLQKIKNNIPSILLQNLETAYTRQNKFSFIGCNFWNNCPFGLIWICFVLSYSEQCKNFSRFYLFLFKNFVVKKNIFHHIIRRRRSIPILQIANVWLLKSRLQWCWLFGKSCHLDTTGFKLTLDHLKDTTASNQYRFYMYFITQTCVALYVSRLLNLFW